MFGSATPVLIDLSPGLRVGSKLMILIFGIHPSMVESNSIALAERFLLRDGVDEEEGEEEDMTKLRWGGWK